ncbi:MAG: hypothetical protein A2W25_05615 [candidate division Zixibacteria bacterium RBG_16_53_22]|nr:MAG: hypothetical protein A2W25_05615 [candidate division Zixibacteria bacterium RBG_16_53_22]
MRCFTFSSFLAALVVIGIAPSYGAINRGDRNFDVVGAIPVSIFDIQTEFDAVCAVGTVHNRITNSTTERATGTNNWTIMMGDDSQTLPSMVRTIPAIYLYNSYLYYASLRIGHRNKLVHLSNDTSDTLIVHTGPGAISDFDTYFDISDQSPLVPPADRINVRVSEATYAWSENDADDFIIYDFWIANLNDTALAPVYIALHADCDISVAEGGSGAQAYSRDDMVDYYRDDVSGEYISYMYDADNPTVAGDDTGGRLIPKESSGFIGSRLLYCPPVVGETTPSIQKGHGWWDWNSDPGGDADWLMLMSDGLWLDPPPSPHDYRFLQKLGPFAISGNDSIRVVIAFGIGEGLSGLRSVMNNAHLLFENNYVYYNLPPSPPSSFDADTIGYDIRFTWGASLDDDLVGYNIFSATSPDGPYSMINGALIDTTFYLYQPAMRDLFYFYIQAVDSGGAQSVSSDTLAVSTLPPPPTIVRVLPGSNYVRLTWRRVTNANAYRIYRSQNTGGPYSQVGQINAPDTVFTDNGVTNYQIYYYVATTIEGAFESPYSGEVRVMPGPNYNGRVLLVDDYEEHDPWGNNIPYEEMRRIYERWGVHNFDYDVWVIADSGMIPTTALDDYQAVVFASDAEFGNSDGTWWYEVGDVGGGNLRQYMNSGGLLVAIGSQILSWVWHTAPPQAGDFEFDWFGIDSVTTGNCDAWEISPEFTWAIGAAAGFPDSMKIDVAKNGDQIDQATFVCSLRPNTQPIFLQGLSIDGSPPTYGYMQPIAHFYRPGGVTRSCLIGFDLKNMPNLDIRSTLVKILRDEFNCPYYSDPAPSPPWRATVTSINADQLYLAWDNIDEEDVTVVRIYRALNSQPYQLFETLPPSQAFYLDNDIDPGTTYRYKLTCVDFAGQEGDYSREISEIGGRPFPPELVDAVSGDNLVTLTWINRPEVPLQNIKVFRRPMSIGDFALIATIPGTDSAYNDANVINSVGYNYYLVSVSTFNVESIPSDTVFAYPHAAQRTGILVVNGVDWAIYGTQITQFYENRSVTGYFSYQFWDLFVVPPAGGRPFPETVLGSGDFPAVLFDAFETIIWVGNSFSGDFEIWDSNQGRIITFLQSGGNMLLLCRFGADFLFPALRDYAHITELNPGQNPSGLAAVYNPLTNISRIGSHSFTDYVNIDAAYTTIIYRPQNVSDWAAGIWRHPQSTGDFVYLAGRPYRHNNQELRTNCEIILSQFFGMSGAYDPNTRLPVDYVLYQNFPNPFNPLTKIKFGLPTRSHVNLKIYDILGRTVITLKNEQMDAGYHEVIWDGRTGEGKSVASGIYFFRFIAGERTFSKKMMMLK